jgi:hypothetical protein
MIRRGWLLAIVVVPASISLVGCPGSDASLAKMPITRLADASGPSATNLPLKAARSPHSAKQAVDWSQAQYTNPEYGLSLRYPRDYALEEGEVDEHSLFLRRQEELEPGTKLLATIMIPEDGYPNTAFEHGSLQVLVHEAASQEGCRDLVDPESGVLDARRVHVINSDTATFWWSEEKSSGDGTQIVEREYATFLSGRCYEFYTAIVFGEPSDENASQKQADPPKILRQLEKILLSAKFYAAPPSPAEIRQAENPR